MDNIVCLATREWELIVEHPFDSTLRKMTVVYKNNVSNTLEVFTKGAAEVLLSNMHLQMPEHNSFLQTVEGFAGAGLRVLCIAHKTLSVTDISLAKLRDFAESDLKVLGFAGLYDPPRPETAKAVHRLLCAGVMCHMLTGDHIKTAAAIAHEVGILAPAIPANISFDIVMSAAQFDAMSINEVDKLPNLPLVIARCSPATKVRMVEALHRRGAFCIMTGDGVNDSPALKRADVGIAMGLNGSDVAKDASDLVLTNDDFASIAHAVEEGRRLFDNIQKFLLHLLVSNLAQVVLLMFALAFKDRNGRPVFPLSPLEILWANMITSSFLAIGLGLEEAQPDIMLRPPHNLKQGVFTWELLTDQFIYGTTMGLLCLLSFVAVTRGATPHHLGMDCNENWSSECNFVYRARATVYADLSFMILLTAWEVKHFSRSLFNLNPTKHKGPFAVFHALWYNRFLFWAVVAGFCTTFPIIFIPTVNTKVFHHAMVDWEWGLVIGCCVVYVAVVEVWKACKRHFGLWSGKHLMFTLADAEKRVGLHDRSHTSSEGSSTERSSYSYDTRTNTLFDVPEIGNPEKGKEGEEAA